MKPMETAIGCRQLLSKLDLICTVSETPFSHLLRIWSECNKRCSSSIKCLGKLLRLWHTWIRYTLLLDLELITSAHSSYVEARLSIAWQILKHPQLTTGNFCGSLFLAIFMCFAVTNFFIRQCDFPCWELIFTIFRKSRFDIIFGF